MVLANVPSFRFSFRGNIRQNHPFGNHPFVNTKKAHWEIKGRFPKGWFWRMYPCSGFRSGGTSAKTTLLETALLSTPEICGVGVSSPLPICLELSWNSPCDLPQNPFFARSQVWCAGTTPILEKTLRECRGK